MASRLLNWTIVSIAAIGVSFVGLLGFLIFGIDNTVESAGFSEERFATIKAKTTRQAVIEMLGAPLTEDCRTRVGESWQYATTDWVWWGPSAYLNKLIEFDSNGTVVRVTALRATDKESVAIGSDKDRVIRALGEPAVRRPPVRCVMYFTRQRDGGAGRIRVRQLVFDESGRVAGIISISDWD